MACIDYAFYSTLYDDVSEVEFNRLAIAAQRILEDTTTGVDGFRKLKYAFPEDEEEAETVRFCMAALISAMHKADTAQNLVQTESGVRSNVITSVSAGNESIHYASPMSGNASGRTQKQTYMELIRGYLTGIQDANGVNLLYMGPYPYNIER